MKLITILLLLTSQIVFSQTNSKKINREDIKKERKAFIVDALELKDSEIKIFNPIYDNYTLEMETIHKERKKIRSALKSREILSDNEIYNLTHKLLQTEKKKANVELKYLTEFANTLGKSKAAKLFQAQEEFKRVLFKKYKNLPPPPRPPKP